MLYVTTELPPPEPLLREAIEATHQAARMGPFSISEWLEFARVQLDLARELRKYHTAREQPSEAAALAARAAFDATTYGDQANDQTVLIPVYPGDVEQPMPVPNDRGSIQAMVRHDLTVRERVGIKRYGTPLQPHNGRDALRDAYEEALDLSCYLRQALFERQWPA